LYSCVPEAWLVILCEALYLPQSADCRGTESGSPCPEQVHGFSSAGREAKCITVEWMRWVSFQDTVSCLCYNMTVTPITLGFLPDYMVYQARLGKKGPIPKCVWHPPNPCLAHAKVGGGQDKALLGRAQARVPHTLEMALYHPDILSVFQWNCASKPTGGYPPRLSGYPTRPLNGRQGTSWNGFLPAGKDVSH
jgi:hypothetical protein